MDLNLLGSIVELGFLALVFGAFLGFAAKKFAVKVDERVEKIEAVLPGANCGACGFPGCAGYAKAVVEGTAPVMACPPGGAEVSTLICEILGTEAGETVKTIAALKCRGGKNRARDKFEYDGIRDCRAAALVMDGHKLCPNGCTGLGTCEEVCPFDAITMSEEDLPIISEEKCTGCGVCVAECPKNVLELIPAKSQVWIACNNVFPGKLVKSSCDTGCIACGICAKNCPADAIIIENNLARIDYEKCTNCQICVVVCPTGTIHTKKSGEISNDAPKIRAALERKKAKEKEKKLAETEAKKAEDKSD
ncbi:MAG TPA: RnfABCDGE type electron transport complex subunit B [candidate division Zixibacteria bacterium]|nr:RnfABCDGE type electron transport complex subunit B [candidate division Zixibacteria bacterium]